MFLLPLLLR
jgi:hypothetical protein